MCAGARASQVTAMQLYIVLCLAATLASGIGEPRPEWSSMFSMEVEYVSSYGHDHSRVWVDFVNMRSRRDWLDAPEQELFEWHNKEYHMPILHRIFPVTTEEETNEKKCFIVGGWILMHFDFIHYALPNMTDYHYVGRERFHGEDASVWKRTYHVDPKFIANYTIEFTVWVADKDGVSVPLRWGGIATDSYYKTRYEFHWDYFDYNPSDIDDEIFNINAGYSCAIAAGAEGKDKSFDFNGNMTEMAKLSQELHFLSVADKMRYIKERKRANQSSDRSEEDSDIPRDHEQTSKALPFPYTPEEVERLSQDLPKSFDWRQYGVISPVNSGGRSYAFAAAEAVESALYIQSGREKMVTLSSQAIVDCSWGFGNRGTDGGSVEGAFLWMMEHGLPSAEAYPFIGKNGYCRIDNVTKEVRIKGYVKVPPNDENALKVALVNHGPIIVYYDETGSLSRNGVNHNPEGCHKGRGSANGAALVVGYGELDGDKYWILKASEGYDFIQDGYALLSIPDNTCGVMNSPLYVALE